MCLNIPCTFEWNVCSAVFHYRAQALSGVISFQDKEFPFLPSNAGLMLVN